MNNSDIDAAVCPYCNTGTGVRSITNNSKVQAWRCQSCGTDWAVTTVNPHLYLDRLTSAVELAAARSVLRQVVALADEAPTLPDDQLRARLAALVVGVAR